MAFKLSPLNVVMLCHTEDRCFREAKDLKLQTKKTAQYTYTSRKAKSASTHVAHASEVTSNYESAEEDFQASGASISWNA